MTLLTLITTRLNIYPVFARRLALGYSLTHKRPKEDGVTCFTARPAIKTK